MSADFEGNDKDAVVTQQVLDVIDSYGFKKEGAYNLRLNGLAVCHGDSRHIKIVPKEDRQGIDIYISGEAKEEQVHIPVVMTEEGVDIVYNDFYIEDGADVTIIAGCGIHGEGCSETRHDGIHAFHVGKNANVKYIENPRILSYNDSVPIAHLRMGFRVARILHGNSHRAIRRKIK